MTGTPVVRTVGTVVRSTLPTTGTTSVTVTVPTCVAGDLLVCYVLSSDNDPSHVTASAGWDAGPYAPGDTNGGIFTFTRTAVSAEGGTTMSVTVSAGNILITAAIIAYQDGYGVDASANVTDSGSVTAAVATAPYSGNLVSHVWVRLYADAATLTIPEQGRIQAVGDGGHYTFAVSDQEQAAQGVSVAVTATQSAGTTHDWARLTLVIGSSFTPISVSVKTPVNNANIDRTVINRFSWPYSSADPRDHASGYLFRYRPVSGGDWVEVTGDEPHTYYDLPANTLDVGQYEIQVANVNQRGAATGAYGPSTFVTACDPPEAFAFDPAPTGIVSDQVTVHGGNGGPVAQYQAMVVEDDGSGGPDLTKVLAATGIVTALGASVLDIALPDVAYAPADTPHVLVKIAQPTGVWQHDWTDSGPLTVNIQPPPTPSIVLDFHPYDPTGCDEYQGACIVSWGNPTPDDPDLAAVSNYVERAEGNGPRIRIADNQAVSGRCVDWIPAGKSDGLDVHYWVTAVTATGATATSA